MFDVNCKAEIRALTIRTETVGEARVPAVDIKLMLMGVHVGAIDSACPQMAERFYDGDQVAVGEVNPFTVQHKLENLMVNLSGEKLLGCDIKKGAKITLLPEQLANVEVTVQARHRGNLVLHVMELLKDVAVVTITERQLALAEMNQ